MHPLTRILAVIFLAVLVQFATASILLLLGGLAILANLLVSGEALLRLLRRSRWLMIMLLLIYAFATPGEYVVDWPLALAPTYEGLRGGLLQVLRLAIMLGAIAMLLTTTPRSELISGIYLLLMPLRWFGCAPERFAARLWLTLHYVEQHPAGRQWQGWDSFSMSADSDMAEDQPLLLEIPHLRYFDWLICAMMFSLVIGWGLS